MFILSLFACADPADSAAGADTSKDSLVGTWSVEALAFDHVDTSTAWPTGWTGTFELRETGVGSLTIESDEAPLDVVIAAEVQDGKWATEGRYEGMLILDMTCTAVGAVADCVDSGAVDWSKEDSDTHVTLLSLARE